MAELMVLGLYPQAGCWHELASTISGFNSMATILSVRAETQTMPQPYEDDRDNDDDNNDDVGDGSKRKSM